MCAPDTERGTGSATRAGYRSAGCGGAHRGPGQGRAGPAEAPSGDSGASVPAPDGRRSTRTAHRDRARGPGTPGQGARPVGGCRYGVRMELSLPLRASARGSGLPVRASARGSGQR
jgi:hypothetical protein